MKIGEVAKRAGIATSTLRYYEQIGLLPPPKRVSGQRSYDAQVFDTLKIIAAGQANGFTLNEIHGLLHGYCDNKQPNSVKWRSMARHKLNEIDVEIQRLEAIKQSLISGMDCDCTSFDDCKFMN
jgi:MerR family redox-sensitive transcriptional activator SoxR